VQIRDDGFRMGELYKNIGFSPGIILGAGSEAYLMASSSGFLLYMRPIFPYPIIPIFMLMIPS